MNDVDFKDKSALRIIGKEFIIVVVVIFSSLGFTLGFFVGKKAGERRAEPISQITEPVPAQQDPELQQVHSGIQYTKPDEAPRQLSVYPQENGPVVGQKSVQPGETETPQPPKEGIKGTHREVEQEVSSGKKTARPKEDEVKSEGVYTVQLGALKNKRDAEKMKAKYEKKGYKIHIAVSTLAKNGKIYKVRTGEFKERKEAEVLSLQLKKIEGLHTFVTSKDE